MQGPILRRPGLKSRAKQILFQYSRTCVLAGSLVLALSFLTRLLQITSGGTLYYLTLDLKQYPMQTGIWQAGAPLLSSLLSGSNVSHLTQGGGFVASLRFDSAGVAFVLPLAWRQLAAFGLISALTFLITVPLYYGARSQFWRLPGGQVLPFRALFRWYTDLRLTGRALGLEVLLLLWRGITWAVCLLPGLLVMLAATQQNSDPLLLLSGVLNLAGLALGYFLYTMLLPGQYLLARRPELSPLAALRKGFGLLRGRKVEFFLLRLSFLPLLLLSAFLYSIPTVYLFPYLELSSILYLGTLEAASQTAPAPPAPDKPPEP